MPLSSDGGGTSPSPPNPNVTLSGGQGNSPGRSRRNRNRNRNRAGGTRSRPPASVETELERYYYEIPGVDWNLPQFREVTTAILNFFVSRRQSAGEYLKVAETCKFVLPVLTEPADPESSASNVDIIKWQDACKTYAKDKRNQDKNQAALFSLLMRQCTDQFLQAVREHQDWTSAVQDNDAMKLLTIFEYITASGGATNVDPVMMSVEAQNRYYSFRQKDNMTNAEYYSRFMHNANVARFCKCALGASIEALTEACMKNGTSNPTLQDLENIKEEVIEREMAMLFITHLDRNRYGTLIAQATNARLMSSGANTFPVTMAGALELLNSGVPITHQRQSTSRTSEIGASFTTNANVGQAGSRQKGGRGGGNGQRQRGGRGGVEDGKTETTVARQANLTRTMSTSTNAMNRKTTIILVMKLPLISSL